MTKKAKIMADIRNLISPALKNVELGFVGKMSSMEKGYI
jgi:hypothetical protein